MDQLNSLFISFQSFIKENPLVAGVVSLWGLTVITVLFKIIPIYLYKKIVEQITTTLVLNSRDDIFYDFLQWVTENHTNSFVRNLNFMNGKWGCNIAKISIGYGTTIFFYKYRVFWMVRTKDQNNHTFETKETIKLIFLGRTHKIFRELFETVKNVNKTDDAIEVYCRNGNNWNRFNQFDKRALDSVILNNEVKQSLTNHIETFLKNKEWYSKRGIPYRTGILLYGPPGTGKSSLIKAVCSTYNKPLYIIDLNCLDDNKLKFALADIPKGSIIAIEDIDTVCLKNRDTEIEDDERDNLSLGGVLNALDGLISSDDRILIATTNHIEKLDNALIREGRFDLKLNLDYLNNETFINYMGMFYPDYDFSGWCVKEMITPAKIQSFVFTNKQSPEKFLREVAKPLDKS